MNVKKILIQQNTMFIATAIALVIAISSYGMPDVTHDDACVIKQAEKTERYNFNP